MLEQHDRALILKGPFKDLSDVLRIARHQGKKIFKCPKVRVDPHILYNNENELIVKVRPEEDNENNKSLWKVEI